MRRKIMRAVRRLSAGTPTDAEPSKVPGTAESLRLEERITREVALYTMLRPQALRATIRNVLAIVESDVRGDIVECGTWKGGSSFAMLLAQRYKLGRIVKPVWMFDSFQGLPPAGERDGPHAIAYQKDTSSPAYFDNCTADIEGVLEATRKFGFRDDEAIITPGWFEDALPSRIAELKERKIALLRIDCDWYDPVSYVLDTLTPAVPEEGIIIMDDYYAWDGCARATHDFLSRNDYSWRIRSVDKFAGAWMVKRKAR